MQIFRCPSCGERAYFHNLRCGSCGTDIAFDPGAQEMVTGVDMCDNRDKIGCNWQAEYVGGGLCRSCAMTEVVPDTLVQDNVALWSQAELAKRWVLANLARWHWFDEVDAGPKPRFHLMSEHTRRGDENVVMGHDMGLVTINVTEADPVEQVRRQQELGESYRTMIGHFRHELAHYLQVRLAETPGFLDEFRAMFGDETADYGAALGRHYDSGPPADWAERFVTPYASAHPHEDWAETVAHLLHLTDIVDSAAAVGLDDEGDTHPPGDAYAMKDAEALIARGADLGLAFNHVNRSMGLDDLYPFVLPAAVHEKLAFAHRHLNP
ncbi:hypothetical protein EKE94_03835 [Mesobaculum littorinae]|uniref:Zinc-ribbon domain-containing protein n=1 Tax=Mesobaculum littorinae TaxID=2486419 RepID=A0A438AMA4_9RHOB|nr:putative zinc-binding metallopeptidase [Mesobaculum littorinae]RVV99812.1 hypothetical protein EKE94_03835 [Mesobaculum littorinae]